MLGEDDDEEDAVQEVADAPTREAFKALRGSYKNTFEFVKALYADPLLQRRMRMIVDGCGPLHSEYKLQLKRESEGQESMLAFACERAIGKTWYGTICETFALATSSTITDRLQLTPNVFNQPMDIDGMEADDDLKTEKLLLSEFFSLIVNLASNRAWTQAFYGLTFPFCCARLLSAEGASVTVVSRLARGILKLEKAVNDKPQLEVLQRLLADIGTNCWVVTRECFITGMNANWNIEDPEVLHMCFALFAGPNNTKQTLENTFSSLKDAVKRFNRNTKNCGPTTKWCYACTAPYAKEGGLPQVELDASDFMEFHQAGLSCTKWLKEHPFNALKHSVADAVPSPGDVVAETRKAGPDQNPASAAAAALVLSTMDNSFENVGDAWAGALD